MQGDDDEPAILADDGDMLLTAALEGAARAAPALPALHAAPALEIGDLLADGNNEVVLFDDGGVRELTLTGGDVVARGIVDSHVTEIGADVSGYHYVTFAGGLTLFYQDGFRLHLGGDEAA
jgi:hypothetical protein